MTAKLIKGFGGCPVSKTFLTFLFPAVVGICGARSALVDVKSDNFYIKLEDRHKTIEGIAITEVRALKDTDQIWIELDMELLFEEINP